MTIKRNHYFRPNFSDLHFFGGRGFFQPTHVFYFSHHLMLTSSCKNSIVSNIIIWREVTETKYSHFIRILNFFFF